MDVNGVVARLMTGIESQAGRDPAQLLVVMNREIGNESHGFAVIDRAEGVTYFVTVVTKRQTKQQAGFHHGDLVPPCGLVTREGGMAR